MAGTVALGLFAAALAGVGFAVAGLIRPSVAAGTVAVVVVATYLVDLLVPGRYEIAMTPGIRVLIDGVVVADTHRPWLLFETGLPVRYYVPKTEVDYRLWNRLIGVDNPERLGEADD